MSYTPLVLKEQKLARFAVTLVNQRCPGKRLASPTGLSCSVQGFVVCFIPL